MKDDKSENIEAILNGIIGKASWEEDNWVKTWSMWESEPCGYVE